MPIAFESISILFSFRFSPLIRGISVRIVSGVGDGKSEEVVYHFASNQVIGQCLFVWSSVRSLNWQLNTVYKNWSNKINGRIWKIYRYFNRFCTLNTFSPFSWSNNGIPINPLRSVNNTYPRRVASATKPHRSLSGTIGTGMVLWEHMFQEHFWGYILRSVICDCPLCESFIVVVPYRRQSYLWT